MSDLYSLLKKRDRILLAGPSSFPPGIYKKRLEKIQKQIIQQAGRDPDFEEANKRLLEAARVLKPFVEGTPAKADYVRVGKKGLPPLLYAAQAYPPPSTSIRALEPEEVDDFVRRQKAQWQKFRKFALLYGWAGELARTLNQDKETIVQVLLHALRQDTPEPDDIVRQAVMRVARYGPSAMKALNWPRTLQSLREKL